MVLLDDPAFPPPQRLAIAYSPPAVRPALRALLAFDRHLARLVTGASEPLMGQIRLAWWRDELTKPADLRARGNPELDALGETWTGEEPAAIALVDGWEHLLGEVPLSEASIEAFAAGRGAAFAGLARLVGEPAYSDAADRAGRCWALADLATRLSDETERKRCSAVLSRKGGEPIRLPRTLRGLAVLDGLARRASASGMPLMAGRGAALAALRLGMFGR